jgi:hypothetical protein
VKPVLVLIPVLAALSACAGPGRGDAARPRYTPAPWVGDATHRPEPVYTGPVWPFDLPAPEASPSPPTDVHGGQTPPRPARTHATAKQTGATTPRTAAPGAEQQSGGGAGATDPPPAAPPTAAPGAQQDTGAGNDTGTGNDTGNPAGNVDDRKPAGRDNGVQDGPAVQDRSRFPGTAGFPNLGGLPMGGWWDHRDRRSDGWVTLPGLRPPHF